MNLTGTNGIDLLIGRAGDSGDRIIYNTTTGALYYDGDGTGPAGAVVFAVVGAATHPVRSAADFLIVG